MISYLSAVCFLIFSVGLLYVVARLIRLLRTQGYVTEINAIWYAFSLVFIIRWAVDIATWWAGYSSLNAFLKAEFGIPSDYTLRLHEWLTNMEGELAFVAAVVVIAVIPQLMTYVLAGIFGCALNPKAVWFFERIAVWSLIKFMAAVSGIIFEDSVSPTVLLPRDRNDQIPGFDWYMFRFSEGAWSLFLAFFLANAQILAERIAEGQSPMFRKMLSPIRRIFTRNLNGA